MKTDLETYTFAKLPPQSKELEEAVLGACLIEQSAVLTALDILKPESFYLPEHQHIYRAIKQLFDNSSVVDMLTIVEQLKKNGTLQEAGGIHYISQLTNKIASSAHVEHHCRIIKQKFIQRELIRLSSELIKECYEDTADPLSSLDKANTQLLQLANDGSKKKIESSHEVIAKTYQELFKIATSKNELVGLDTGLKDLNAMTGGLQAGLYIIAARPGMGKSAFVLSILKRISIDLQTPALFLTIEMSNTSQAKRLLSNVSDIDFKKILDPKKLTQEEWKVLDRSKAKIESSPLYWDESSEVNLTEIRAKALQAYRDKKIKLIVVDYLQLMTGDNAKIREQEISSISRCLKAISKDLDIPVIALSQLNRGVDNRADKRPNLSDLRECLSLETSMIYTEKSFQTNLNSQINLLSLSKDKLRVMPSVNIPKTKNTVYRLKTTMGRFIDCTLNHPILTTSGYKKLSEITKDDSVALACGWENKSGKYIPESRFIGWMIGNGCMYGYNVPSFITSDETVSNDFCEFINSKFGFMPKFHPHYKSKVYQWGITKNSIRVAEGNPVTNWLKENDLWGKKAKDKHIPNWFMDDCDEKSIVELLQGLFETDGSIQMGKKHIISYSTTSIILANQIIYLLSKLGIIASIDNGYKSNKATTKCYKIIIASSEQKQNFINKISLKGYKGEKLSKIKTDTSQSNLTNKINRDTTVEISKILKENKSKDRVQIHGNRRLTKANLLKVINNNPVLLEKYKWIASENIFWDTIESITEIGVVDIFDRSVPKTNNFIVNGIIVHNSGAIEQDADLVMFIYRDEYYDKNSPDKGITEIIVAKNRNGNVNTIKIAGDLSKMRFSNLTEKLTDEDIKQLSSQFPNRVEKKGKEEDFNDDF